MRYADPFRFYLSASIIFFIIWSSTNEFEGLLPVDTPAARAQSLTEEEKAELREDLKNVPGIGSSIQVDSLVNCQINNSPETYFDDSISQKELDSLSFLSSLTKQFDLYNQFHKQAQIFQATAALDSLHHTPSTYNRWVYKKTVDINIIQRDPQVFLGYFISKLPFIIFFYLPVFALFIWLLYLRTSFNYMEHLIFAFHVQTTYFVLAALSLLLDAIFDTDIFFKLILWIFLFYL